MKITLIRYICILLICLTMFSFNACQNKSDNITTISNEDNIVEQTSITESDITDLTKDEVSTEGILTLEQANQDAEELINTIEGIHPIFLKEVQNAHPEINMPQIPIDYEAEKEVFLLSLKEGMSVEDFYINARIFISNLNDLHTDINLPSSTLMDYINIKWNYDGESLTVSEGFDNIPIGSRIVSIGGVQLAKLVELAERFSPVENETGKTSNVTRLLKHKIFLSYAKADINENYVEIKYINEDKLSNVKLKFIFDENNNETTVTAYGETIDGKYILKISTFKVDTQLTEQIKKLKMAINDGIDTIVIDVRKNFGGNFPAVASLLFDAMHITVPEYGTIKRKSDVLIKQGWKDSDFNEDTYFFRDSANISENPNNINLFVLTDENSFSSSVMLAAVIKDGKLGSVIGQMPPNNASMFADLVFCELTNSKITYTCSTSFNFRPDTTSTYEMIPDIIILEGEDAMNYLNNSLINK